METSHSGTFVSLSACLLLLWVWINKWVSACRHPVPIALFAMCARSRGEGCCALEGQRLQMEWWRVRLHLIRHLNDIISPPNTHIRWLVQAPFLWFLFILLSCCLFVDGGGGQQRPAQAGVTLKTATGNLSWLQTFVRRDGSVSKEPDGHRYVCFAVSCTRGNSGWSTKTRGGGEIKG